MRERVREGRERESNGILMSCQPNRVISGRMPRSMKRC